MARQYALRTDVSTLIGADGTGVVRIGPTVPFTRWHVEGYTVQSAPMSCNFHLYKGEPGTNQFFDYTFQGGSDTSANNSIDLFPGEYLTGQWDTATPGASATFTIIEGILYEDR